MEKQEIVLYTKIIKNELITVSMSQECSIFYVKIGQKWSFNKIEDIGKVIMAFNDENLDLLKDVYSKNALLHDLYDAGLISKEKWFEYRDG